MLERQVDVSVEAVDAAVNAIESDRRLGEAFVRERWAPMETFTQCDGPALMLEFLQYNPGERCVSPLAPYQQTTVFEVLI